METKELPEFHGDNPWDVIANLYLDLGWDGQLTVNPSKIIINETDWVDLHQKVLAADPDPNTRISSGLLLVDRGPSADLSIGNGKVLLEDGWIEGAN